MVIVLINRDEISREEIEEMERIAATNYLETRFNLIWERYGSTLLFDYDGMKLKLWHCAPPEAMRPHGYRIAGRMFDIKVDDGTED